MDKIFTIDNKIVIENGKIKLEYIQPSSYTIAFLPDTQSYVNYKPSIMVEQIDWLISNKDNLNLQFVAHEGDIVQNYDENPLISTGTTFTTTGYTEWSFMQWQMNRLIDSEIPYSTLPGNHDYKDGTRDNTMLNSYFPLSSFTGMTTYQGSYDIDSDNTYHIVNVNNNKLLILSIEFGPRQSVLDWADTIVKSNSTIPVILVTHAYVSKTSGSTESEVLLSHDMNHAPSNGYGLGSVPTDVNDPYALTDITSIWRDVVYPNNNVRFVISGHDATPTVASNLLISQHSNGVPIYQILSNFQYFNVNDAGHLVTLTFGQDTVNFRTYSPFLDEYKTDEYSQGDWDWSWTI